MEAEILEALVSPLSIYTALTDILPQMVMLDSICFGSLQGLLR